MDKDQLKRFLKFVKNHEESMSLLLGLLVILGLMLVIGWHVSRNGRTANTVPLPSVLIDVQLPQVDFPQSLATSSSLPLNPLGSSVPSSTGLELQGTAQPREYTVQPGEGLWQIAERFYGDGNKYVEIYEANRDVMKSIEDIRVGMTLRIP